MNIARIDKATGVVLNVEVADQEWLVAHADDPDCRFVAYAPDESVGIGRGWDEKSGFEPVAVSDVVTVEVSKIDALGLTAKQRASLGLNRRQVTHPSTSRPIERLSHAR